MPPKIGIDEETCKGLLAMVRTAEILAATLHVSVSEAFEIYLLTLNASAQYSAMPPPAGVDRALVRTIIAAASKLVQ